jgi:hypothetical protein
MYRKVEHVQREIDPDAKNIMRPSYALIGGAVLIGLGGLVYGDADSIAAQPTQSGQKNSPDDIRTSGIVVGALALPLLAAGVIDALRLRDTDRDLGEAPHNPDVTSAFCHRRALVNEELSLETNGADWHVTATSDDHGVVRFPVRDLPESAFQGNQAEGELHLVLGIDKTDSVRIAFDKSQGTELLASLARDPGTRIAIDRAAALKAADAKLAAAKEALTTCQSEVDSGDLTRASSCWQTHASDWSLLGVANDDAIECLTSAGATLTDIKTCVTAPERTDDDILRKAGCMTAFESMGLKCGALDLTRLHAERQASLDISKVNKRVDAKADSIRARQLKAAAAEQARAAKAEADATAAKQRCIGSGVLQIVLALRVGRDVDPSVVRGCSYTVTIGTVETTTRDGWMIVSWGPDMAAAFKSSKRHADGSLLRTNATAAFAGLKVFDRVDGGSATIPTFVLSE